MRAHTDRSATEQNAAEEDAHKDCARRRAKRAVNEAAHEERIAGASVALTEEVLEQLHAGPSDFGVETGLTKRCQSMLERAKHEFPSVAAQPEVKWKKGDSKSALAKEGARACV